MCPWDKFDTAYDLYSRRHFMVPKSLRTALVPNALGARLLRSAGYLLVDPVGAPFIYGLHCKSPRISNSRLLMPGHTLSYYTYGAQAELAIDRFIKFAHSTNENYAITAACIHWADAEKGLWPAKLNAAGIPWISGAAVGDRNSLRRMIRLLSQFEHIVTNEVGSHLIYAAKLNCSTEIVNTGRLHDEESMTKSSYWMRHPHGLQSAAAQNYLTGSGYREWLARRSSDSPTGHITLSKAEIDVSLGLAHIRSPEILGDLLGWRRGARNWWVSQIVSHDRIARSTRRLIRQRTEI